MPELKEQKPKTRDELEAIYQRLAASVSDLSAAHNQRRREFEAKLATEMEALREKKRIAWGAWQAT